MRAPRILIVEDDSDFRERLSQYIKDRFSGEVVVLSNGYEALSLVEKESFDVILTDHIMPGADGIKILMAAKKKDPKQVVLVITGTNDSDITNRIDSIGGLYIGKPINFKVIKTFIEGALLQKGDIDFKRV